MHSFKNWKGKTANQSKLIIFFRRKLVSFRGNKENPEQSAVGGKKRMKQNREWQLSGTKNIESLDYSAQPKDDGLEKILSGTENKKIFDENVNIRNNAIK